MIQEQTIVRVVSVTLKRWDVFRNEELKMASSWKEASEILKVMAKTAPVTGFCGVHYHAHFSNGCSMEGVYRLRGHDMIYGDLYRRVKDYCEFYAGKKKPVHISDTQYMRVISSQIESHLNYLERTIYPSQEI